MATRRANQPQDIGDYCREIETYLCQKNEGHLIRIAGPAFEQVCGWAAQGVPLQVAFRGIDRYCERYYAKGPRRRPVRIEFCEADILEMFDDWRRAVGVSTGDAASHERQRIPPLASHIERAIARLVAVRSEDRPRQFAERLGEIVRELDALKTDAQRARGDRRARIVARLDELDRDLMALATAQLGDAQADSLKRDAAAELAPFAPRMPRDAYENALRLAFWRLLRESIGLPLLSPE